MNSERRILRRFCAGGTAALAVVLGCAAIASANGASGSSGASGASGGTGPSGATAASLYPKLLTPPAGDVFTGLSGIDPGSFQSETGKHPAVYGFFITWAQNFQWAFNGANAEHSRLMLHISTSAGYGAYQEITPAGIADGSGDGYILALQAQITKHNAPVYIRLLPEMNNANNAYSADNADGSSRGPDYSHKAFIAAWRRTVLIMRGGPVATIDAKLKALRLPPLQGRPQSDTLPKFLWRHAWLPPFRRHGELTARGSFLPRDGQKGRPGRTRGSAPSQGVASRPVSRVLYGRGDESPTRRPFLWDVHRWTPLATNPSDKASGQAPRRLAAPRIAPIRFCSRRGLPCRRRCRPRGALLPHPFTLTFRVSRRRRVRRFAFCGAIPGVAPAGRYPAPCPHGARTFLRPRATAVRPTGGERIGGRRRAS